MSLETLLSADTCTVRHEAVTQDASGGPTRAWSDLYTSVPCRVIDPSASMQVRFMALGTVAPHRVLHQQAGVGVGMLIVTSDGRTLRVEGTMYRRPMGGVPGYYESTCTEWRPGA